MTDKYKFDEARAKAGHPVQFSRGSLDGSTPQEWVDVYYIGRDVVRGGHIVQFKEGNTISTGALRMAPAFRKVFVNLWDDDREASINAVHYQTAEDARTAASINYGAPLIAVAVPIDIEVQPESEAMKCCDGFPRYCHNKPGCQDC